MPPFTDRTDAGRQLAGQLASYSGRSDVLVLALPRGGVPVAAEVARSLAAPFDVFLVRKLGVPGHEELAMGAVAEGGVRVLNESLIDELAIPESAVDRVAKQEQLELERRAQAFRGARTAPDVAGRLVILVDDGLATGATMEAAVMALRQRRPARIVIAVPVAAREAAERLNRIADELVAVALPEPFYAVGGWYEDFAQTTDREVVSLLATSRMVKADQASGV